VDISYHGRLHELMKTRMLHSPFAWHHSSPFFSQKVYGALFSLHEFTTALPQLCFSLPDFGWLCTNTVFQLSRRDSGKHTFFFGRTMVFVDRERKLCSIAHCSTMQQHNELASLFFWHHQSFDTINDRTGGGRRKKLAKEVRKEMKERKGK